MITIGGKDIKAIVIDGDTKEVVRITDTLTGDILWEKVYPVIDYFYIENTYNGTNTVTLTTTRSGSPTPGYYADSVEWSKDKVTWTTASFDPSTPLDITLDRDEKVYFRNDTGYWNFGGYFSPYYRTSFSASQSHVVGGNIISLLDYNNIETTALLSQTFYRLFYNDTTLMSAGDLTLSVSDLSLYGGMNQFEEMFSGCTSLNTAPTMPATTMGYSSYRYMYYNCQCLTTPPQLPATTLAPYCYDSMFYNSGLTTPPALPATTLADGCYFQLFRDCTSLASAPQLPATTMAREAYSNMFSGCSSLTTPPQLPATTLAKRCYVSMFYKSGLTTPPQLPATTLADGCYSSLFAQCRNLTSVPQLPATTMAEGCYSSMFYYTGITTPPQLPATTLAKSCYSGMFMGCRLTSWPQLPATTLAEGCYKSMFESNFQMRTAPELPATTLVKDCYNGMFRYSNRLTSVTVYADDNSATDCTANWLQGVAASGTIHNLGSATYTADSASGIPTGWTEVNN